LEARSPFEYSIRMPACSPIDLYRVTRNSQKAKGLERYCKGEED